VSITSQLLQDFSAATLDIQRLAQDKPIERFHRPALERIQQLLPFSKAWWGRAALIDGLPEEHSRHLFELPTDYLEDWQSIRHQDITVGLVYAHPGQAAIVDMLAPDSTDGLRWLATRHDIAELICIIHTDPLTQLSDHLTLYRQAGAPRFSAQDRLLLNNLMPHLVAAVSANQIRTLVAMREQISGPRNLALAVCDQHGTLHCAERGFIDLLLAEWPRWNGPRLPTAVGSQSYAGKSLLLESSAVDDLFLLAARSPNALQQLSARESDVAQLFGEGKTYKEIARALGLAPNTVRHHIRTIYSKLGIKDKASVAHLLNPD
jgi:DNA-binding CsgD family transcriptional regulator